MKRALAMMLASMLMSGVCNAAADGGDDAGAQMRRAQEAMERQRVAEQIAEDEATRAAEVEREKPEREQQSTALSFRLQRVDLDRSEVLSAEDIQPIVDEYIGRDVSLDTLNELVNRITELYTARGYMTCRASLPPQRIHDGVVRIGLFEGRTGAVSVHGNKHTRASYITRSFPMSGGAIDNTRRLTEHLQWFNGVNDVQLRMGMKAGTAEGTTDYDIYVFEPRNQRLTVGADHNGYESSGRWREYVSYSNRSLTNQRDAFRLYYQRSKGTDAWGAGYTLPLGHRGIKLDFDYSRNDTETIAGQMKRFGVESDSYSAGVTLRVPFKVDRTSRYEAGFQFQHQESTTDFGTKTAARLKWVDDNVNRYAPYVSFTHYGDHSVMYHKHAARFIRRRDLTGSTGDAVNYELNGFLQRRWSKGQTLSTSFDAQLSSRQGLGSSDRFFIGGANSVRGYEESYLGGEEGFTANLEYGLPLDSGRHIRLLTFVDYGRVYGSTVLDGESDLIGTGVGLNASYKEVMMSLTLGVPLKRHFGGEHLDKTRLHFSLNAAI